jgi:ABC-type branched-subunit amino acid transport system substrate-binding protein
MKKQIVTAFGLLSLFLLSSGVSSAADNPKVFKLGLMSAFSGTFAAAAETQKKGVLLAMEEVNARGGLNMPWGKVKVEVVTKDDEAKLDVGVRRFRELMADGIHALTGSIWNPMMAALNEESKVTPVLYFPAGVAAYDSFKKGNIADGTFVVGNTPWSLGYLGGGCITKLLKKKRIYNLSRADSWGTSIRVGLDQALKEYGGEVIGLSESQLGTIDFTPAINKAMSLKAEVFYNDFFGGDAIASFKQAYELGLSKQTLLFNAWMTNVVAQGIPENALAGLYALQWWYYGLDGFEDKEIARKAREFTETHMKKWNEPPDAFTAKAYVACEILFQGVEKAGTFDVKKVSKALIGAKGIPTLKGDVYIREDHQMIFKHAAFLVKGKGPKEKKNKWDFFTVEGYFGGESAVPPLKMLGY